LVDFAHQLGFQVIICTSASRLEEFAEGLSKKIYHLLLSLEAVGEKHDNIRAHPGLFQKVLRGVEKLRQLNPKEKIIIWSNLSQINLDQVPALAQLARELKVFIEFFPMAHFPGFNDHLVLNPEEREEVFSQVISLKAKGYPILNTFYSLKLMKDGARFRCNMPRFSLQMLWDGSLWPCEPRILKPVLKVSHITFSALSWKIATSVYFPVWLILLIIIGFKLCEDILLCCIISIFINFKSLR